MTLKLGNIRNVSLIIEKILSHMNEIPPPNIIAVFTLYGTSTPLHSPQCIASAISESLPTTFCSTVEIHPIQNSEILLKSFHARGTKTYAVVYDPNVFRYISPEQFLTTHYEWLWKEVRRLYDKEPQIHRFFSEEDAFQECYFYLDRILSKFINPDVHNCNLRTFISNRLRRYFSRIVEKQLQLRLADLKGRVKLLER
tara:strand:+ start:257 stop:850 length:594 start_codon:yes stop_codon:yes gene_type:complete